MKPKSVKVVTWSSVIGRSLAQHRNLYGDMSFTYSVDCFRWWSSSISSWREICTNPKFSWISKSDIQILQWVRTFYIVLNRLDIRSLNVFLFLFFLVMQAWSLHYPSRDWWSLPLVDSEVGARGVTVVILENVSEEGWGIHEEAKTKKYNHRE